MNRKVYHVKLGSTPAAPARRPWPRYIEGDLEAAAAAEVCDRCEHLGRRCCGHRYCKAAEHRTQQELLRLVTEQACPLGRHPGQEATA